MSRMLSFAMVVFAFVLFVGAGATAQDRQEKNGKGAVHTGKFLSAEGAGKSFKMEDKDGKEHSHTLAADAKVYGPDGKECKLGEIKRGQAIRVTTREDDKTTATKVEAIRAAAEKDAEKETK